MCKTTLETCSWEESRESLPPRCTTLVQCKHFFLLLVPWVFRLFPLFSGLFFQSWLASFKSSVVQAFLCFVLFFTRYNYLIWNYMIGNNFFLVSKVLHWHARPAPVHASFLTALLSPEQVTGTSIWHLTSAYPSTLCNLLFRLHCAQITCIPACMILTFRPLWWDPSDNQPLWLSSSLFPMPFSLSKTARPLVSLFCFPGRNDSWNSCGNNLDPGLPCITSWANIFREPQRWFTD